MDSKSGFVLVLCLLLASCSSVEAPVLTECQQKVQRLKWLDSADATEDARKNTEDGDLRYRALGSFGSIQLPSITSSIELARVKDEADFVAIENTGHSVCSDEYDRLNERAFRYAETYNRYITQYKLKNLL